MNKEDIRKEILTAMEDIILYSKDELYIKGNETVFERLSSIYLNSNGKYEQLKLKFPEYF